MTIKSECFVYQTEIEKNKWITKQTKKKDAKSNQKNKLYNHRKYKAHIIN